MTRMRLRRLAPALLLCGLFAGALDGPDRAIQDAVWSVSAAVAPSELRFVDIEQLPANKPLLAATLDFLAAERARLIVLDLQFPQRVDGDQPVLDAIARAGGCVIGFQLFEDDGRPAPRLPVRDVTARDIGFIDIPVDPDGVVRKFWFFRKTPEDCYRSLAFSAFLQLRHAAALRDPAARAKLLKPDRIGELVRVDHQDGEAEFPVADLADAASAVPLSHFADPEARAQLSTSGVFRDRVVFLGLMKNAPRADGFRTAANPSPDAASPGVVLHAAALQSLLAGRADHRAASFLYGVSRSAPAVLCRGRTEATAPVGPGTTAGRAGG